ncbi:MAG: aldo/keto reductase [Candidatus Bathyarchaeota archaeon]|nr:MAG: aldo/keto reductase [Candidatus Bathyarchaeota archaeon]
MNYRKLGSIEWKVSTLGFGCMRLPARRINRLRADTKKSVDVIRYGIDQGINYIDTAWPYHLGDSEKILGEALKEGYRERVFLVTKLPMFMVRNAKHFDKYLTSQMKRLQTDYLDGYLFHALSSSSFEKLIKLNLIKKMEKAKQEGFIHSIGFSFHDTLPVFKQIVDYYPWDLTLVQYNYVDTNVQATTQGIKYAHSKDIAVTVMEPLKGGTLANLPSEAQKIIDSAPIKRSAVDWALQFVWNMPEVSVILSGMNTKEMIDQNCTSADHSGPNSLTEQDLKVVRRLAEVYREKLTVPCTACGYCLPCPEGVNIPQNFACLNNVSLETSRLRRIMAKRAYKKLANTKDKLNKNNLNGNANLCIQCNQCVPKCPQQINIPQQLETVKQKLGNGLI